MYPVFLTGIDVRQPDTHTPHDGQPQGLPLHHTPAWGILYVAMTQSPTMYTNLIL